MPKHPEPADPALRRLRALADLDAAALAVLEAAIARSRCLAPHQEILAERERIAGATLLLEGWAIRTRMLPDGRRQILNILLPGDLIGHCHQDAPVASSTVLTLTRARVCPAPDRLVPPTLEQAYRMSVALDEAHDLRQITRLGRMTAHERMLDLFLELYDRLALAGLAQHGSFAMAATQEVLADLLGLTAVHVNRVIQQMRRLGEIDWSRGRLELHDLAAQRDLLGWQPVYVSARWPRRD
jgi:CRP-like cAMP-binding protein